MSKESNKYDNLFFLAFAPVEFPLFSGLPFITALFFGVMGTIEGLSEAVPLLFASLGFYLFGVFLAACELMADHCSDRKLAAQDHARYLERWQNFCHLHSIFVEALGFYEAMTGKKLKKLKALEQEANDLLVLHARWKKGSVEGLSEPQMSTDLAAMSYRMQEACDKIDAKKILL